MIGLALAGIVPVADSEDAWSLWNSMIGAVLLLVLCGYASDRYTTRREAVAFAAVAGFAFVITIAPLVAWLVSNGLAERGVFVVLWILASAAAIPIDAAAPHRPPRLDEPRLDEGGERCAQSPP